MTRTFRKPRRLNLNLESLDTRVLPSAASVAHHLAVLAREAHHAEVVEARVEAKQAALEAKEAALAAKKDAKLSAIASATTKAVQITPAAPISATSPITPTTSAPSAPTVSIPTTTTSATVSTSASTSVSSTSSAAITSAVPGSSMPTFTSSSSDVSDVTNGPLAKAGQTLISVYEAYESYINGGGSASSFTSTSTPQVEIVNGEVGVDLSEAGDMDTYIGEVTSLGMTVQHTDSTTGTVEGLLPVSDLIAVAQLGGTAAINPVLISIPPATGSNPLLR